MLLYNKERKQKYDESFLTYDVDGSGPPLNFILFILLYLIMIFKIN